MTYLVTYLVTKSTPCIGSLVVTGNKRMQQRPLKDMVDALRAHGCKIEYLSGEGCPPIRVLANGLPGGTMTMSAQISSQFVSGVLLAAPLAQGPVTLQLVEDKVTAVRVFFFFITLKPRVLFLISEVPLQLVEDKVTAFRELGFGYRVVGLGNSLSGTEGWGLGVSETLIPAAESSSSRTR